jgi:hypothetical protein
MTRPVTHGPTLHPTGPDWPDEARTLWWSEAIADVIACAVKGFATTTGVLAALWLFGWLA